MFHVARDKENREKACANFSCSRKNAPPKATYFYEMANSWVCGACSGSINREWYAATRGHGRRPCMSSEEKMLKVLSGK